MVLHSPPPKVVTGGDTMGPSDDVSQTQTQQQVGSNSQPMETAVRRSERSTKGLPPNRYDVLLNNKASNQQKTNEINEAPINTRNSTASSIRSTSRISRISTSSSTLARKQLEIELKRQEELAALERKQDEREKRRAEREREIIELRARLQGATLIENGEFEGQSKASNFSEHSVKTVNSSNSKVTHWLKKKNAFENERNEQTCKELQTQDATFAREHRGPQNANMPYERNAYIARHAIGKDLPIFKGSMTDWILFEKMFEQTTEACRFSPAENMLRLQKCLQGDALEAVRALLTTTNVDRVMKVLRNRFGRADHIIEDLMNKVSNSQNVREDRPLTIIRFAEIVTNLVATIESLNEPSYLSNPMLVKQLVNKLPAQLKRSWAKVSAKEMHRVNLQDFADWATEEAEFASAIYQPEKERNEKRVLSCREEEAPDEKGKEVKCLYCGKKSHKTSACYAFLKLTVDDRWLWVRQKKVCFGCLSANHGIRFCKNSKCTISGCFHKHHTTLHNDFLKKRQEKAESNRDLTNEKELDAEPERVNCTYKEKKRIYLPILPVTLKGKLREIDTYALLDGGSTVSLISEDTAEQLGLQGPVRPLIATWFDDTVNEDYKSRQVSLEIRGASGKFYKLQNVRTTKMTMPGQSMTVNLEKWTHLKDLDIPDLENAIPTIIIGQDNIHLQRVFKQVSGKVGTPLATLTPLGWMVHGTDYNNRGGREFMGFTRHTQDDNQLNDLVREFWTTESFGVSPSQKILSSTEEQRARHIFEKTFHRVDNRWEVGLLWKTDREVLPTSRENALKRLISMENKMTREPQFGKKYRENIQAYVDKGYARQLSDEEAHHETERTWYLPHFAAYNPQKPEKLRMVFDAAAKSYGVSLNDRLIKGPDILKPLPGLLFKFREKRIALCGDLREMFHQVRIREEDRSSQRFLWRDKDTKLIITMEMTVMIFGAISSPYLALEVKNRNAEQFKESYPEAYKAIVDSHYMDDYIDSTDTIEEAIRRLREVMFIHEKGGFEMRNVITNSSKIRTTLNPNILAPAGKGLTLMQEDSTRILGVSWTPDSDSFFFSNKFPKLSKDMTTGDTLPTKRQILKVVMSLFDPLGLLAPLIIRAKILLQDIWKEGTQWDEKVSTEIVKQWNDWLENLHETETLRIPRHYAGDIERPTDIQLHVFCDASIQAFAAAAYLRLKGETGIQSSLVMSKTRVAPIKILTVPRLELQSAVMAVRLATFIKNEHRMQINRIVFWSDSQTVLAWIRSDARKYHPFVAHRIAEILDVSATTDWRWVPTDKNVADDATRSRGQDKLQSSSRWYRGPDFLRQEESEWPIQKTPDKMTTENTETMKEMKREFCCVIQSEQMVIDSHKYSSWLKATRIVAWIIRFITHCKKKETTPTTGELNGEEMQQAEKYLLRQSQQESFPTEWKFLQSAKEIPTTSKIFSLSPVFKDEIIRLDGRITNKDGSAYQPIILDSDNNLVKLLIQHYHEKVGHHGRERVVNDLRELFWITKIRTAVRRSWNDCLQCKHRRTKPMVPRMAPLPPPRLQDSIAAFTHTGVDYFGPMQVTIGRRREKRYGVLFTCLTVRAVHIEVAASLDTDSMLMALRRMMSRRGKPKHIYSDNGTNFRGASEELKKATRELDRNEILRQTAAEKIDWHFIPPASPHMGGCWERLIGSVKRTLSVTLKERAPREEVLQTLLAEAEYSINSRPLTYVSDDPTDHRSLTPNDFLGLQPGTVRSTYGQPCLSPSVTGADTLRRQWRYSQCLADHFWKRWIKEYLPSINRRAKWHRERPDLQVNDLVVIWDENAPRNQWKRGRVTAVHPGRDGRVRVADVLTSTGTLRRSSARLCVLEIP